MSGTRVAMPGTGREPQPDALEPDQARGALPETAPVEVPER